LLFSDGTYWLGGQIEISVDTPITEDLIVKVEEADKRGGAPATYWEIKSAKQENEYFAELRRLRNIYLNRN
jgi:hypothetical protein